MPIPQPNTHVSRRQLVELYAAIGTACGQLKLAASKRDPFTTDFEDPGEARLCFPLGETAGHLRVLATPWTLDT